MTASLGKCSGCGCDIRIGLGCAPGTDGAVDMSCDCRCHHNWRFIHRHPTTTGDPA